MKNIIYIKAWMGELSFPIAFWVVQFITSPVLFFILVLILPPFIALTVTSIYVLYAAVCVNRCSKKYRKESKSKHKNLFSYSGQLWAILCAFVVILHFIDNIP